MEDMNMDTSMQGKGTKAIRKTNDAIRAPVRAPPREESPLIHRPLPRGSRRRRVLDPKVIAAIARRNRSQSPSLMEHNNS